MTKQTTLTLTDDRQRLEDRLREELDDTLPDSQFRGPLVTMAYAHLLDSLTQAESRDVGEVPHEYRRAFNTRVVKYRASEYVETQRP